MSRREEEENMVGLCACGSGRERCTCRSKTSEWTFRVQTRTEVRKRRRRMASHRRGSTYKWQVEETATKTHLILNINVLHSIRTVNKNEKEKKGKQTKGRAAGDNRTGEESENSGRFAALGLRPAICLPRHRRCIGPDYCFFSSPASCW